MEALVSTLQFEGHAKFPEMQRHSLHASGVLQKMAMLSYKSPPSKHRLTPIICPLPMHCRDQNMIQSLLAAGISGIRILCAFGNSWQVSETIKLVQQACKSHSEKIAIPASIAILVELKGTEIRIGHLEGGEHASVELVKGGAIRLTINNAYADKGTAECVFVDYEELVKIAQPGMKIFIEFGLIQVICDTVLGAYLTCTVDRGGTLRSQMRIHLQGVVIPSATELSEKDKADMDFAMELDIDMFLINNVTTSAMVKLHREYLAEAGMDHIKLISKVSSLDGLKNIEEIARCSDFVLVGRDNLGVQMPSEIIFKLQKKMIARCRKIGTPLIISSQFLNSMVSMTLPKCTDMIDIGNAIVEGINGLSLFSETSVGSNPLQAIEFMDAACREAEAAVCWKTSNADLFRLLPPQMDSTQTTAWTTVKLAQSVLAAAIIMCTVTGKTAKLVSRYMPQCPVIAVTRDPKVAAYAAILRSVYPLQYLEETGRTWIEETENRVKYAIKYGKAREIIKTGDPIVIVKHWAENINYINTIRLEYVSHFPDEVSI